MASRPKNSRKVRLVFGRGNPLLKTALLTLVTVATISLVTLSLCYQKAEDRLETLYQQAAQLEEENTQLESRIGALGTPESIRQIAAEELGLVDPNTIIIESSHE